MSPHFVLGRENVPCVAEVVNRSLKADCTDFTITLFDLSVAILFKLAHLSLKSSISFDSHVSYLWVTWHVFPPEYNA